MAKNLAVYYSGTIVGGFFIGLGALMGTEGTGRIISIVDIIIALIGIPMTLALFISALILMNPRNSTHT